MFSRGICFSFVISTAPGSGELTAPPSQGRIIILLSRIGRVTRRRVKTSLSPLCQAAHLCAATGPVLDDVDRLLLAESGPGRAGEAVAQQHPQVIGQPWLRHIPVLLAAELGYRTRR